MDKRSEVNPKQEKRDSVLVSCKGTPKRDGRAKRSQSQTRKTRQRSCFLQRNSQKGWASIAKPIPNKKNATAFLFLAKEPQKGWASEVKSIPTKPAGSSLTGRWKKKIKRNAQAFTNFLQRNTQTEMGEHSEANSGPYR